MWTNYQILIVLGIIVVAGLLGGWGGYLTDSISSDQQIKKEIKSVIRKRYFVLGVIAAGSVPLFFKVLQSELISNIFGARSDTVPFVEFLVFTGFCLVAAFTARSFLDTLNRQLIRDVNIANTRSIEASNKAMEAHEIATDVAQELSVTSERSTAPINATASSPPGTPVPEISADDAKILFAASKKVFRTATGISEDTGIPRNRIGELLDNLEGQKLVERTTSPSTGGQRWQITALRYAALKSAK